MKAHTKKTKKTKKAGGRIPTKRPAQPVAAKTAKANGKAAPRPEAKKAIILGLLHREQGATISQIAEATGWQNHSIRGFISTARTKMALPIQSLKNEAGDRIYRFLPADAGEGAGQADTV